MSDTSSSSAGLLDAGDDAELAGGGSELAGGGAGAGCAGSSAPIDGALGTFAAARAPR
jgi:hypothetical protein